jgi:tRNA (cmo5U34)-methyltransferase
MLNEFDKKAGDWDKNPMNSERSEAIAGALLQMLPVEPGMKALEYGAGTGLLSFLLKDRFAEITLMDSSTEMIRIVREKIDQLQAFHLKPLLIDLEKEDFPGVFDMIYSQMVFHHVNHVPSLLSKFNRMLRTGGFIAVADLYSEDGSFHGEGFGGHNGFDPAGLASLLRDSGFDRMEYQPCYTIRKKQESGVEKEYPVFLMTAVKS